MSQKKGKKKMTAVDFLSDDLVYELLRGDIRVKKLLIKGGFGDWLLVITAKIGAVDKVAFVGSNSLENLARKVHKQFVDDGFEWKDDQYAN